MSHEHEYEVEIELPREVVEKVKMPETFKKLFPSAIEKLRNEDPEFFANYVVPSLRELKNKSVENIVLSIVKGTFKVNNDPGLAKLLIYNSIPVDKKQKDIDNILDVEKPVALFSLYKKIIPIKDGAYRVVGLIEEDFEIDFTPDLFILGERKQVNRYYYQVNDMYYVACGPSLPICILSLLDSIEYIESNIIRDKEGNIIAYMPSVKIEVDEQKYYDAMEKMQAIVSELTSSNENNIKVEVMRGHRFGKMEADVIIGLRDGKGRKIANISFIRDPVEKKYYVNLLFSLYKFHLEIFDPKRIGFDKDTILEKIISRENTWKQ